MRRLLIATLLVAACGGTGTPASSPASSRCQAAAPALVDAIEAGLTVTGGGSLANAQAVQSTAFQNGYFVSARIEGQGMSSTMGTWATNDLNGGGSIFSADSFAREFSEWGDGPGFSSSDDGFEESRRCAGG